MVSRSSLTVFLFSFGYHHSGPPADDSVHGGGFVFDCRALSNPFWDEALRPYSGGDAPVRKFLAAQPEVRKFADHAGELVSFTARAYAERGHERLMVSFGCTGGRHRSVYLAEQLRERLEGEGFRVTLTHLDVERVAGGEEEGGR